MGKLCSYRHHDYRHTGTENKIEGTLTATTAQSTFIMYCSYLPISFLTHAYSLCVTVVGHSGIQLLSQD